MIYTKVSLIVCLSVFILTLLTIRIYPEDGKIVVQWGLKPLIEYYKKRKRR